MIDNRNNSYELSIETVKNLCSRKFGIGSDGLILIQTDARSDFEMVFYNPDGSQSLCGNGSRCAVNFAHKLGMVQQNTSFKAYDGIHEARILPDKWVKLRMKDVQNVSPVGDGMFIDTGSPHLVKSVEGVARYNVYQEGKAIRNKPEFREEGVNVNFIEKIGENEIFVRTYERGVENETYSCGTGVTAAALASSQNGMDSPVKIKTLGGGLEVTFTRNRGSYSDIYLTGPAVEVFQGRVTV